MARSFLLVLLLLLGLGAPARAATASQDVQTIWRLLDYIGVDYREAVASGKVVNQFEYAEMVEFSSTVSSKLGALPAKPEKVALVSGARDLQAAVAEKEEPAAVSRLAKRLAAQLLAAYPVPLAPSAAPDMKRGAALYAENCASCHGTRGEGPPPAVANLDPPPIAFADRERARERSIFGLYQVITQGLEDTAMQSFAALPEPDRWALAFHSSTLAFGEPAAGERLWREDATVRALVPDLATLVALTPAELESSLGPDRAAAVTAYLRANPGAVLKTGDGSLRLARTRLRESFEAYGRGDPAEANRLALSAYLDGFEPVEAVLQTRDGGLMLRAERAMAGFRQAILRGDSEAQLRRRLGDTEALLDQVEAALAPEAESGIATFLGAFAILLREGLEALLVVIAMIAFLRKAERTEALPYVHGGWVAALFAGVATWFAATYAIGVSGQSRELAEGAGGLVAALVLLWVGVWMHGKAQADEWRRYIAEKMQGALSRGSAWFLFGLAFLVVYREAFETILFYAALWTSGNGGTILAGALAAVLMLAGIAWVMLRLSKTLPIGQFFRYSALLIAILAVILIGKGMGALQEAGTVSVTPVPGAPRIVALGLFPTMESLGAQLAMIAALLIGFRSASRPRPQPIPAE
ncbi:MAG TPA: FTR1 family protein [Sphingomicrobium sp.]|nr:FTR1 family protein [Sphingomicrobium sp.]